MGACNQDPAPLREGARAELDRLGRIITSRVIAPRPFQFTMNEARATVAGVLLEAFELGEAHGRTFECVECEKLRNERDEISRDRTRVLFELVSARAARDKWKARAEKVDDRSWSTARRLGILRKLAAIAFGEPMRAQITTFTNGSTVATVRGDSDHTSSSLAFQVDTLDGALTRMRDELVERARRAASAQEASARKTFEEVEQACSEWEGGP